MGQIWGLSVKFVKVTGLDRLLKIMGKILASVILDFWLAQSNAQEAIP